MITTLSIDLVNVICQSLKPKECMKLVSTCKSLWKIKGEIQTRESVRLGKPYPFKPTRIFITNKNRNLIKTHAKLIDSVRRVNLEECNYDQELAEGLRNVRDLDFYDSSVIYPVFPPNLESLVLRQSHFDCDLSEVKLPNTLRIFTIEGTNKQWKSKMATKKSAVKSTKIPLNEGQTLHLPSSLVILEITGHLIHLECLPDSLKELDLFVDVIIKNPKLPKGLRKLELENQSANNDSTEDTDFQKELRSCLSPFLLPELRSLNLSKLKFEGPLDFRESNLDSLKIYNCEFEACYLPSKLKSFWYSGDPQLLILPPDLEVKKYDIDCECVEDNGTGEKYQLKQEQIPHKADDITLSYLMINENVRLPKDLRKVMFSDCEINAEIKFSDKLEEMTFAGANYGEGLDEGLRIPDSVKSCEISSQTFESFSEVSLPENIEKLIINDCEFKIRKTPTGC
jgi:hypothetical protein